MYSSLGLVIFVAVERTFVCFTKGHDHFISNSIRCGCLRTDQCNIACLRSCIQKCTDNIGRRHSARRHRIAPFDVRRASLPVAVAIITWQDEIGHVCWLPLRLCVCVSVYHQKFVRSIASRVLEIS